MQTERRKETSLKLDFDSTFLCCAPITAIRFESFRKRNFFAFCLTQTMELSSIAFGECWNRSRFFGDAEKDSDKPKGVEEHFE